MSKLLFEGIEQASDAAVENRREQLETRLTGAAIALYVREKFDEGKRQGGGLKALAQILHIKVATLEAEADTFVISSLLEGRPTLNWTHLQVLRTVKKDTERKLWADLAVQEDWSPAQLRREIQAKARQPQSPDIVLKKVGSWGEKGKSVIDQSAEVGVLAAAEDRVESLKQYIVVKRREQA